MASSLSHTRLLQALDYAPLTGVFTWLISRPGRWSIKPGDVAGSVGKGGAIYITLDGSRHAAHRLAFFHHKGKWPKGLVDHKNGDASQNWFLNLRDTNQFVNMQNLRNPMRRADRSVQLLGVRRAASKKNPWAATITVRGVFHHLGNFKTPEMAHAAYIAAKRQLHEGCTI